VKSSQVPILGSLVWPGRRLYLISGVVVLPTFSDGEYPTSDFDPLRPGLLPESSDRRAGIAEDGESSKNNRERE